MSTNKGLQSGFSLLQPLVAVGILGITTAAWMGQIQMSSRLNEIQNLSTNIQLIRNHLITLIQEDMAWKNSVNDSDNQHLRCLALNVDCDGVEGPIQLRDRTNVLYAGLGNSDGFSSRGEPCVEFPSQNCPIKVSMTWKAVCPPSGACNSPLIQIEGRFQADSSASMDTLNLDRYRILMTREQFMSASEDNLAQLGSCPSGSVMKGYDSQGRLACMSIDPSTGISIVSTLIDPSQMEAIPVPILPIADPAASVDQPSPRCTPGGENNEQIMCKCYKRTGFFHCTAYGILECHIKPDGTTFYSCKCPAGMVWVK